MFAVGAWDQIICFADDMREYFKRFSCDALSFSAGIGFFKHDYPIARMASEVGELESFAKRKDGKDRNTKKIGIQSAIGSKMLKQEK